MNIVAEFDSSVADAPAGYMTAVQAAINYIDQTLIDPITVKLMFSWGELQGQALPGNALGESSTNGYIEPYSQVVSWLTAAAASQADTASVATLPAVDPTNGASFWVSDSEAKIFGASADPHFTDPEDGFVALTSAAPLDFDPSNRGVPGEYDAIGILEHEITEALGRIGYLGLGSFESHTLYSPLDLFRYTSPGVRDLRPATGNFSVNGQTLLLQYNNPRSGADATDWNGTVSGDAFGFGDLSTSMIVTPTDLLEMDVIGFRVSMAAQDDFNDDQKSDVLIQNGAGSVVVGEVGANNAEVYAQVAQLGLEWKFVGTGDYLGDGNLGFLIENTGGTIDVGEVVGSQTSYTQVASLGPEWTFEVTGDFLSNGKSDFLIENTSGALVVGEVTGGQAAYTQIGALGPEWKFEGAGDFLAHGDGQFLIENTAGAVVVGEVVGGQATYTQVAALGPEWKFEGVGDFLGHGDQQFLIENTAGAVVIGEVIDGQTTFVPVTSLGSEWIFKGAGDFLGEGHAQFLIENTAGAVVVGDFANGQIHFTQVSALGSDWLFHL